MCIFLILIVNYFAIHIKFFHFLLLVLQKFSVGRKKYLRQLHYKFITIINFFILKNLKHYVIYKWNQKKRQTPIYATEEERKDAVRKSHNKTKRTVQWYCGYCNRTYSVRTKKLEKPLIDI